MTKEYACFYCFTRAFGKRIEKLNLSTPQKIEFTQFIAQLGANNIEYSSPDFSAKLHRKIKQLTGIKDIYEAEKHDSNIKAQEIVEEWKPKINQSDNVYDLTLRLAIAGNIMDYGASPNFDIEKNIEHVVNSDFTIDHSLALQNEIRNAKQILYLGDNAGEIVFDKLFISYLQHPNIYFAVRGCPIINDVTVLDATETGMDKVAKIISNGYDAPSTILEKCSPTFQEVWNNSDLIISKGQGNLEGLMDNKTKNIYFLLMVKCEVIAEHLNVKKGDFVVYNQPRKQ